MIYFNDPTKIVNDMKETFKYFKIALVALVFIGCKEDFVAPTEEPSNNYFVTGFGNNSPIVQINGYETFSDLSTGVVSRKWTFPGGDVSDIATSGEQIVRVGFFKTGEYEIKLNHTFKDNPYDLNTNTVNNSKTIDTTITVSVVDSVTVDLAAFYVNIDGSIGDEMDLKSGALNPLMAGEKIRFIQSSPGAPSTFEWETIGGSPAEVKITDSDSVVDIKYKRLGKYDLKFEASRTKPQGSDVIVLEDFLEVIPSTRPVILEEVVRRDSNTVALVFSRSIADPKDEVANFSVRVRNTIRDNVGDLFLFDQMLNLNETRLGTGDEDNIVLIDMHDNIYNSDTVLVSYAAGNLKTTDDIAVSSFTETELEWPRVNLAAAYGGFENGGLGWNQADLNSSPPAGAGIGKFTTDNPRSGNYSAYLKSEYIAPGSGGRQWTEIITDADLNDENAASAWNVINAKEGDQFVVSYYAYVVSYELQESGIEAHDSYLWDQFTKLASIEFPKDSAIYETGKWYKIESLFTSGFDKILRPYFRTIGQYEMYIDDLSIRKSEARPFVE